MGIYHQGGVVSAQLWLGQQEQHNLTSTEVFWWRTYSPPVWLLGGTDIVTVDLMGMEVEEMLDKVSGATGGYEGGLPRSVGLVAPWSSGELDAWIDKMRSVMVFEQLWKTKNHLNLDDLDFGQDGIRATLERVVGRRGLVIWKVSRHPEVQEQVVGNR